MKLSATGVCNSEKPVMEDHFAISLILILQMPVLNYAAVSIVTHYHRRQNCFKSGVEP